MDEAGIDRIVMQGWYWQSHELCVEHNDYMIDVINRYPERFIAFASINPKAGWKAIYEIERCLNAGMKGVGELGPQAQGFSPADTEFIELVKAIHTLGGCVCIHSNEPVGLFYFGKDTTPLLDYFALVKACPDGPIVLAHWGGGMPFYEMMPSCKRVLKNVFYDTAGAPLLYDIETFSNVLAMIGSKKLLYGSDYPLILYPRAGQKSPGFKQFVDEIKGINLGAQVYEDVMGLNAEKLLEV
jgi:predicted TIM-barrel fold metal-dependent hydrolase